MNNKSNKELNPGTIKNGRNSLRTGDREVSNEDRVNNSRM